MDKVLFLLMCVLIIILSLQLSSDDSVVDTTSSSWEVDVYNDSGIIKSFKVTQIPDIRDGYVFFKEDNKYIFVCGTVIIKEIK